MTKEKREHDFGCDSRCVDDYVECMTKDNEEDDPICKTRQHNCMEECPL